MISAPASDLIPISALTHSLERFHCRPFSVDMSAGACLANQDSVASPDATPDLKLRRGRCLNCADGQQIRQQLAQASEQEKAHRIKSGLTTRRKRTVRPQDDDQDLRRVNLFFDEDIADEIERESVRLNRKTCWLIRHAWKIAKDRIQRIEPEKELDDATRLMETQAVAPAANTSKPVMPASDKPRCPIDGCTEPPGNTRPSDHCPPDLVALCAHHRKIEKNRRWRKAHKAKYSAIPNSSPAAPVASSAPATRSMDPMALAELHELCVSANRQDLAIAIGTALASAVREGQVSR